MKFTNDATELLKLVGDKENVYAVSHCMTRMRFVLNDPSKADVKAIEKLPSVKGSFVQAGQFQVIIGNEVKVFFNEFIKISGLESTSKAQLKSAAKKNQNFLQNFITILAEIFSPLIPAIIAGGLILGFRNCIDSLYLFDEGTKTLVQTSQFWAGMDDFLWLIGEAVFHMLPVGICWSITKRMGGTEILGIIVGLTLVSGQLLNAYAVASTPAADIPFWNFGFMIVQKIGYQGQVLPAILAGLTVVYTERLFRKISPQAISMITVPFFTITISVIAAHAVLGPIGWYIGSLISSVVHAGITGPFKLIFGAIFGFVYAPLVITGLHHMTNAIDLQLIADFGGTKLWPLIALSNIAQGSAVLGMIFLQRRNAKAQEVNIPSCISCYLGVTEPAMFGVNLKYAFPFLAAMIGASVADAVCVTFNTTANAIGVGGIPGILSIKPQYMLSFALCMLIAIVIPFVLVLLFSRKRLTMEDITGVTDEPKNDMDEVVLHEDNKLTAYVKGEAIPLKDVNDGIFSAGMVGEGMAIRPHDGVIYAPADVVVTTLMESSRHALGLRLKSGAEILIHVGLDTVKMEGEGFEYLVEADAIVKRGTPLMTFDSEKIKAHGYDDVCICVITDPGKAYDFEFSTGKEVDLPDTIAEYKVKETEEEQEGEE